MTAAGNSRETVALQGRPPERFCPPVDDQVHLQQLTEQHARTVNVTQRPEQLNCYQMTSAHLFNSYTGYPYGRTSCIQTLHRHVQSQLWSCSTIPQRLRHCRCNGYTFWFAIWKNYELLSIGSGLTSGERAFSYAGPAAWNRLPYDIRGSTFLDVFKRKLKTRLFTEAFSY